MKPLVFIILMCAVTLTNACWFYSKEKSVQKIKHLLEKEHISEISKSYIKDVTSSLPAPVQWAINSIGVHTIFEDCDANGDDTLTVFEIEHTDTCLSSCTKMGILNTAIRL